MGIMVKTILLTGATGFLGSHLLQKFINTNYNVIILKRSFSDIWRIEKLINNVKAYDIDKVNIKLPFEENHIDFVVNTVTNYGRNGEKATSIVETNLMFCLELLETAAFFNTDTFFHTDTLQYKYLTNYTLSKKQFVEWGKSFAESERINFVNIKLEHMYGPKDDENKFVMWLIKKMLDGAQAIDLTLGEQKRDFIFIDDVVSAYSTIIKSPNITKYLEYEIGMGQTVCLKDFIIELKSIIEEKKAVKLSTKLNFGALPYREGEPMEIKADISKISELGWKAETNIKEGIQKTVESIL